MFKPMLAGKIDPPFEISSHRFPLYASRKLDGVRATIQDGKVISRSLKPIANAHIQRVLGRTELNGLDGELICGNPTAPDAFRKTASASACAKFSPSFTYWVFDVFIIGVPFKDRLRLAAHLVEKAQAAGLPVKLVEHVLVNDLEALLALESRWVAEGYEGLMIRSLSGPYKQGRSTEREGWLLKLKRFTDGEAVVLDVLEQMHNDNPAGVNELGHTERSSCKDGLVPAGTVGSFLCRWLDTPDSITFKVAPGSLTDAECDALWERKSECIGKVLKFRYFPTGSKDKPRFPQFVGFRDSSDL